MTSRVHLLAGTVHMLAVIIIGLTKADISEAEENRTTWRGQSASSNPLQQALYLSLERNDATEGMYNPFQQDSRKNQLSFGGQLGFAQFFTVQVDSLAKDRQAVAGQNIQDLFVGQTNRWEQNQILDTKLTASAFQDRLRFKLRQGWSGYDASNAYLRAIGRTPDTAGSKRRFMSNGGKAGNAFFSQVEADMIRMPNLKLTLFGDYRKVGYYYEDIDLDRQKAKNDTDPFTISGLELQRYGGNVNFGPIGLKLSQSALANAGRDNNYSRERRYDIQTALDLTDLRHRTGDLLPSPIWSSLPTSIWVGYGRGAVDSDPQGGSPNDMTKTLSAGMDWGWDNGYANLSSWSLFMDGRQPGAEAADWSGKGTDISLGFYGNSWNIDGYLSVQQSNNQDPWTKSADRSLGGGLSINLYPKSFPALLLSLYKGGYRGEYFVWQGQDTAAYWSAAVALDFSRYLVKTNDSSKPRLSLVYKIENNQSQSHWEESDRHSGNISHFMGVIYRAAF